MICDRLVPTSIRAVPVVVVKGMFRIKAKPDIPQCAVVVRSDLRSESKRLPPLWRRSRLYGDMWACFVDIGPGGLHGFRGINEGLRLDLNDNAVCGNGSVRAGYKRLLAAEVTLASRGVAGANAAAYARRSNPLLLFADDVD
ncbi:MAG: hypothetical protein FWD57_12570, partial [Polyangiaceae bacterium]|nr:hypothetical protein [Polyangiaceae bacterium]